MNTLYEQKVWRVFYVELYLKVTISFSTLSVISKSTEYKIKLPKVIISLHISCWVFFLNKSKITEFLYVSQTFIFYCIFSSLDFNTGITSLSCLVEVITISFLPYLFQYKWTQLCPPNKSILKSLLVKVVINCKTSNA